MPCQNLCLPTTLNPNLLPLKCPPNPLSRTQFQIRRIPTKSANYYSTIVSSHEYNPQNHRPDLRAFAGRSKPKSPGGRIEGDADLRREAKRNARRRSKKYAESLFYRLKNPHKNYPDNFTEDELQMIGLGYDRLVRFMDKDDPNLKHPYDWYKYGEFGPYSWRGVVLGEPIRGRFSDERVSMIGEVRDQEEWEKIEQFDMAVDFQSRLDEMDRSKGLKNFWVFVRHPKWRVSDLPWEQWTLVCEVVVESGNKWLDKWSLMGRLGNKARSSITRCAAWMRPDIIYVRKPVYQCRFEPQDEFFAALAPLLDPETEEEYMCELENDDGTVELCTYFGGLCMILRANPKAFVDDVVKGFEKLSDEKKSKCLAFLLNNHPVMLLHPYTKEWKARLEEMEMGCDAPEDDEEYGDRNNVEKEIVDWFEDDGKVDSGNDDDDDDSEFDDDDGDDYEKDDVVFDAEGTGNDDALGILEEDDEPEEDAKYWEEELKKAMRSNEDMEKIVKKSIQTSNKLYEKQLGEKKQSDETQNSLEDGDELEMRGKRAKVSPKEWKLLGYGPYKKRVKKSKIPPGLFLRAAVRPFFYRNLVKEIVLIRHAIVEGDIGVKK